VAGNRIAVASNRFPERSRRVAFSDPYIPKVREIVVSAPKVSRIDTIDDLSGRDLWVRRESSYVEHLGDLSARLQGEGKKPINVRIAPRHLVTEDLLELVNAGVFELTVADEHIAKAWAGALPGIRVRDDLVINSGGAIAWAVRRDSSELKASLDSFLKTVRKGTLLGNIYFKRYFTESEWISNMP